MVAGRRRGGRFGVGASSAAGSPRSGRRVRFDAAAANGSSRFGACTHARARAIARAAQPSHARGIAAMTGAPAPFAGRRRSGFSARRRGNGSSRPVLTSTHTIAPFSSATMSTSTNSVSNRRARMRAPRARRYRAAISSPHSPSSRSSSVHQRANVRGACESRNARHRRDQCRASSRAAPRRGGRGERTVSEEAVRALPDPATVAVRTLSDPATVRVRALSNQASLAARAPSDPATRAVPALSDPQRSPRGFCRIQRRSRVPARSDPASRGRVGSGLSRVPSPARCSRPRPRSESRRARTDADTVGDLQRDDLVLQLRDRAVHPAGGHHLRAFLNAGQHLLALLPLLALGTDHEEVETPPCTGRAGSACPRTGSRRELARARRPERSSPRRWRCRRFPGTK